MENQYRINAENALKDMTKKYEITMDELKESVEFIAELREEIHKIDEELTKLKNSKELYTQFELFSKTYKI